MKLVRNILFFCFFWPAYAFMAIFALFLKGERKEALKELHKVMWS